MNPALLESLASIPGVAGLCHHRGGDLLWSRLPEAVPPARAEALCASVSSAFAVYAGAGRMLREAWFEFPNVAVFVSAGRQAEAEGEFLTFLVTDRSAAETISAALKGAGV